MKPIGSSPDGNSCIFRNSLRNSILRSLNLPASLEALERPIGLPPSLLQKAEEVRLEQGPDKIEAYLDDIQRLARRAMEVLDEVRL